MTLRWRAWLCLIGLSFAASPVVTHAAIIDVRFAGLVTGQGGTGLRVGDPYRGEFVFDSDANRFMSFEIGGAFAIPGFSSSAFITADRLSAVYRAELPRSQNFNTFGQSFTLDLEGLSPWPDLDAVALLTNSAALATNLDTDPSSPSPSTFTYRRDSGGIGDRTVFANLTSLEVSVPEPTSLALLMGAGLGLVFCRRKA